MGVPSASGPAPFYPHHHPAGCHRSPYQRPFNYRSSIDPHGHARDRNARANPIALKHHTKGSRGRNIARMESAARVAESWYLQSPDIYVQQPNTANATATRAWRIGNSSRRSGTLVCCFRKTIQWFGTMQFNMQWLWMLILLIAVLEVSAKHKKGRGSTWW